MKHDEVLPIKEEFFARLEAKNSWGKNEIKALFKEVLIDLAYGKPPTGKPTPDVERAPVKNAVVQAQNISLPKDTNVYDSPAQVSAYQGNPFEDDEEEEDDFVNGADAFNKDFDAPSDLNAYDF